MNKTNIARESLDNKGVYLPNMEIIDMGDGGPLTLTYYAVPICAFNIVEKTIKINCLKDTAINSGLFEQSSFWAAMIYKLYNYGLKKLCKYLVFPYLNFYLTQFNIDGKWLSNYNTIQDNEDIISIPII